MTTLEDILNLVASYRKENRETLSKFSTRLQQQEEELARLLTGSIVEQDSTISRQKLSAKIKDMGYWYTNLSQLDGYNELSTRLQNCLSYEGICYLGDLVILNEKYLKGTPNLGRSSFSELEAWLTSLGEALGQELMGYHENKVLLERFDEPITTGDFGAPGHRNLPGNLYKKLKEMGKLTVGQLATSHIQDELSTEDMDAIRKYLKEWSFYLKPGMPLPYRP